MAFVLKEAFRYQNFLEDRIQKAYNYLRIIDNVMHITYRHNRSAVQPDAKDEILDNLGERELSVRPDVVIDFIMTLYKEKEIVSNAINNAKIQHCPDLDMQMSLNKTRQCIVDRLKSLALLKNKTDIRKGIAYCFNNEGNQTEYRYDIDVISIPDFDRANVKKLIKEITSEADAISTRIDYYLSSVPVNVGVTFDINDSFEELIEKHAGVEVG